MAFRTASRLARALSLTTTLAGSALAADPTAANKTIAQSLFEEARHLMDQGNYAEACPRFADSENLDPGGGTILNLALCYEKLGKLATAYSTYSDAASTAIAEKRHDREKFARARAAALSGRLPHVTVRLVGATDATVTLDGSTLPKLAWTMKTAVDPGDHAVEATAPGFEPWKATVTVAEGEAQEITITLVPTMPPAASEPPAPLQPPPSPPPAPPPSSPIAPPLRRPL